MSVVWSEFFTGYSIQGRGTLDQIVSYCIHFFRFVFMTSKAAQMGQTFTLSQKLKMKVI